MSGHMRQRGDAWELAGVRRPGPGERPGALRHPHHPRRQARSTTSAERDGRRRRTGLAGQDAGDDGRAARGVGRACPTGLSPKTVLETRGFIDRTIKPELGRISPRSPAADHTRPLLRPAAQPRRYTKGRALAPATVRRIHGVIRRALAQGVRWGWLGSNPAASASPPRVPAPSITPPTPGELARLLEAAEVRDPDLAMFLKLPPPPALDAVSWSRFGGRMSTSVASS